MTRQTDPEIRTTAPDCMACSEMGASTLAVTRVVVILPTGPRNTRRHSYPSCKAHAIEAQYEAQRTDATVRIEDL